MWQDITSYSRMDTERKPRVLECHLTTNISFKVHKHIHYGGVWLLSSECVGVRMVELGEMDVEEAKRKGMEVMLQKLKERKDEVDRAIASLMGSGLVG